MTDKQTGGPAFPALPIQREINGEMLYQSPGLTIRDYFAAKALACWHLGHCTEDYHKHAARQAYAIADAMLEERSK